MWKALQKCPTHERLWVGVKLGMIHILFISVPGVLRIFFYCHELWMLLCAHFYWSPLAIPKILQYGLGKYVNTNLRLLRRKFFLNTKI